MTALIVGCRGQDGKLLSDMLRDKGYAVIGIDVGHVESHGIAYDTPIDISDAAAVHGLLDAISFDEIYYFAAYHHSSEDEPIEPSVLIAESYRINVFGLVNFLDAMRRTKHSRMFYAASSLLYSSDTDSTQKESSPCEPSTVYGITKWDGRSLCRFYRNTCNVFASVGIFFNHESPYRGEKFISKKIVSAAVNIKRGEQDTLIVGDLNAAVDWGYAPDYVDAAWRILSLAKPDDFIIATGKTHTVREFARIAFGHLGLSWEKHVREKADVVTRRRRAVAGNASKLRRMTGWKPTVSFTEMVRILVEAQDELIEK
ncbi:MAG: GDP-mannose 4,6-dehydratase [Spirochaetota bacterium]